MNTPIPPADPYPSADGVWCHLRIAPGALLNEVDDLGSDDALWVRDGQLVWAGPRDALPAEALASGPLHDGRGSWLTPGWVDCHTHLVYAGQRCREFALRLSGASYEAIARAGGGILSTVAATRAATEDELFDMALPRLHALLDDGVCAIEIKSGYGLSPEHERKMLRVARRLGQVVPVTITTTFLGAHAIAPEWAGRPDDYIETVCQDMLPPLASEGLVDAVDVFCDRIGFSRAQTERVFQVAASLGLPVKLHAGQFSDLGGVELAARFQALSCDHLEHLRPAGIEALRQSGTVAVLLPGAFHTLRETQRPPIEALRQAGVPMAIATDHNPGSSPALSLVLMTNLACCHFQMTVPEVLAGVTRHAARALGLQHSHGHLHIGQPAQFALWHVGHWEELPYWMGHRPLSALVSQGRIARRACP